MVDFRFRKFVSPGDHYSVRIPGEQGLDRQITVETHKGARLLASEWMHRNGAKAVEVWSRHDTSTNLWQRTAWRTAADGSWEYPDDSQDWDII